MRLAILAGLLFSTLAFADQHGVVNGQPFNCPDYTTVKIRDGVPKCIEQQQNNQNLTREERIRAKQMELLHLMDKSSNDDWDNIPDDPREEDYASEVRRDYNCQGNLAILNGVAFCDGVRITR